MLSLLMQGGVTMRITLKQWLETNYNKHRADAKPTVINVFDTEYMQGVTINVGSPLEQILVDRPIVKFLDFYVVSVELAGDRFETAVNVGVTDSEIE